MSFHDQVMQARANAERELAQLRQLKYQREHDLTDQDKAVLKDVHDIACHPNHRPPILKAASGCHPSGTAQDNYILYRGDDLECLNHLKFDVRSNVIKALQDDIRDHYGEKFAVRYSDSTYEGYHTAVGRDAELRLHW